MEFNLPERRTEYTIESAIISNARLDDGILIDIRNNISSFEIYEHINKPYITAKFLFLDHNNILQSFDFSGGEKLSIVLQHSEEKTSGFQIEKDFLIDKIENIFKTDERTESVVIHCIEYHAFESSVQNISRSYSGSPSTMIEKILLEYLDKELSIVGQDSRNGLKVIVPNLHPIEASMWLKNKVVTSDGMPFYLFSTLALNNLVLKDLGTMLTQTPINTGIPFIYAPSISVNAEEQPKFYTIDDYSVSDTEDLYSLIRSGLVGANYQFYDTSTGLPTPVKFDVDKVFKDLVIDNKLGGSNARYVYGSGYEVRDRKVSTYDSKVISQISTNGAFKSTTSFKSYNDETTEGDHRKKIVSLALQNFLAKSPLTINVRPREFLTGDENYTIGKTIRIIFLDNNEEDQSRLTLDTKKSGDYIICAAKHQFGNESAATQLLCGKLGYFGQEFEL